MNCRSIPERDDWFLTDRKPTICPRCGTKEVRKAVLGYPTEEDFYDESLFIIGCIPDPTPVQCKFGCRECDSKFWKDTPEMRDHVKEMEEWRKEND